MTEHLDDGSILVGGSPKILGKCIDVEANTHGLCRCFDFYSLVRNPVPTAVYNHREICNSRRTVAVRKSWMTCPGLSCRSCCVPGTPTNRIRTSHNMQSLQRWIKDLAFLQYHKIINVNRNICMILSSFVLFVDVSCCPPGRSWACKNTMLITILSEFVGCAPTDSPLSMRMRTGRYRHSCSDLRIFTSRNMDIFLLGWGFVQVFAW